MPRPELQQRINAALVKEGGVGLDANDLYDEFSRKIPEHVIAEELALMHRGRADMARTDHGSQKLYRRKRADE